VLRIAGALCEFSGENHYYKICKKFVSKMNNKENCKQLAAFPYILKPNIFPFFFQKPNL
jgi:hypothetical protein